jgi:type IV pilus assembly protein PilM
VSAVNTIGLDIGSTSIRAVETMRTRDRTFISNFGQALLPDGAVSGGVIKDDRAVTAALRHMWASYGFRQKDVALGVAHQQVIVREVEIANLPAKEMRESLPYQVRDAVPLPIDEALLDFFPLEKAGKKATVRGLLVAAPKDPVINTVRAVERAGLRVATVDLACFAALRAAAHLAADTEAVVDIGASATNIVIHIDGVPQIVRSVPRGGAEITRLIASRMSMSPSEAETLKRRTGLNKDEDAEAAAVANEALRPLLNEIRSSFAYYLNSHPDQRVSRLALVGGAAQLPGLTERLADELGVRTFISDPLQRINDSRRGGRHAALGRIAPSAAVSIGLALGAA